VSWSGNDFHPLHGEPIIRTPVGVQFLITNNCNAPLYFGVSVTTETNAYVLIDRLRTNVVPANTTLTVSARTVQQLARLPVGTTQLTLSAQCTEAGSATIVMELVSPVDAGTVGGGAALANTVPSTQETRTIDTVYGVVPAGNIVSILFPTSGIEQWTVTRALWTYQGVVLLNHWLFTLQKTMVAAPFTSTTLSYYPVMERSEQLRLEGDIFTVPPGYIFNMTARNLSTSDKLIAMSVTFRKDA